MTGAESTRQRRYLRLRWFPSGGQFDKLGSTWDKDDPGDGEEEAVLAAHAFGSAEFKAKVALEAARDCEVEKLHAMIGQLVVERDFSKRASGR